MAAANGDASAASSSAFSWGEGFMDVVAKYERNSERQLYVYGISVSRCASCLHRLKSGVDKCENCGHAVSTRFKNCMRCSAADPGLWCYECDAYFCNTCRNEPHVLELSGNTPAKHNCFPIDGSSGKLLRSGAWSSSLLALAKTARRSQMKLAEDKANYKETARASNGNDAASLTARMENLRADEKTSGTEKERKLATKETSRLSSSSRPPTVPAAQGRQPSQLPATVNTTQSKSSTSRGPVRSRSPSPIPSAPRQQRDSTVSKSPSPTKQSSATPASSAPPSQSVRPDIVEAHSTEQATPSSRKRKASAVAAQDGAAQSSVPPAPQRPIQPPDCTVQNAEPLFRPVQASVGGAGQAPIPQPALQRPSLSPDRTVQDAGSLPSAVQSSVGGPGESSVPLPASHRPNHFDDRTAQHTESLRRAVEAVQASGDGANNQTSLPPRAPHIPIHTRETIGQATGSSSGAAQTSVGTSDGSSLYAQLRQRKLQEFLRTHSTNSSPATNMKRETVTSLPSNPPTASQAGVETSQWSQVSANSEQRTTTGPNQQPHYASRGPQAGVFSTPTPQASVKTDPTLAEVLTRPIEAPPAPVAAPAVSNGGYTASSAVDLTGESEDVLQDAVVNEYNRANAHTFGLEDKLAFLTNAVHQASMQDVASAAVINARMQEYRRALRIAEDHREKMLANVIIFSPEIQAMTRNASPLHDIPEVTKPCHKICAELETKIADAKMRHQLLREAMAVAASNADTPQIIVLAQQMRTVDEQIRSHKDGLNKQFTVMFQFSKSLRDTVQSSIQTLRMKRDAMRASR